MRYLLLIVALILLLGMGRFFGNPLDRHSVVYWTPSECVEGGTWEARYNHQPLAWAVRDSCLAFERGFNFPIEACCVHEDGDYCIDRVRLSDEGIDKLPAPCDAIYGLSGAPFRPEDVTDWNSRKTVAVGPPGAPELEE
jgi:hypothetical protein